MSHPEEAEWNEFRRRLPMLVENYKGLCFAAFARTETIAAVGGCSIDVAATIQGRALDDFMRLMHAVRDAKRELKIA